MFLEKLFNPKSIAVIGASRSRGKLGRDLLVNIIKAGFKGKIYPINPKAKKILGLASCPSVLNIKHKIDLSILAVPAKIVIPVLRECGKKKIKNVIIITAGFKEIGGEGIEMENELIAIAKKYKINLLGPNCLGILDSNSRLNASFANGMIALPARNTKKISFISQSGAICTAMMDWADKEGIGFSRFISLGNKAVLNESSFLKFFSKDKDTNIILGYLEGVKNGKDFIDIASKITRTKPVILIKSGKSQEAQKAISSHTGSLTGEDEIINAAFRKSGVIRAENLEELFNLAKGFSYQPLPNGNKAALIVNAGGLGVMAADAMAASNLSLAQFEKSTKKYLKKNLPFTANINNPIDVVGDAGAKRYQIALIAALKDKNVDAAVVVLTPQTATKIEATANTIVKLARKFQKPILASFVGGKEVAKGIRILNENNIPAFKYPEEAIDVLAKMWDYKQFQISDFRFQIPKTRIQQYIKSKDFMSGLKLLSKYKIPTVKSILTQSSAAAARAAKKVGYPVAMKIINNTIIHKTDAGGVAINLLTSKQVKEAFASINKLNKQYKAENSGVLVQPMLKGYEIIIGMKRDAQFGPVIMFGLGGIYVELFKDVATRIAPISHKEAKIMMEEIKGIALLKGARGQKKVDLNSIADIIVKISQLSTDYPDIKEIDLNPVMVNEKGLKVVDVRIL